MVRVSSPAKLRPWSELIAKMVMGVVPGLVIKASQHIFHAFSCPHFQHFLRFVLCGVYSDPCFCRVTGPPAFSAFSRYRVRIADFEDPTDRLCCAGVR